MQRRKQPYINSQNLTDRYRLSLKTNTQTLRMKALEPERALRAPAPSPAFPGSRGAHAPWTLPLDLVCGMPPV